MEEKKKKGWLNFYLIFILDFIKIYRILTIPERA